MPRQARIKRTNTQNRPLCYLGNALGTGVTALYNNLDPYSENKSLSEINSQIGTAASISACTKLFTTDINAGVDMANATGTVMPGYTKGFGVGLKTFFAVLDDAITFIWGDEDE